MPVDSSNSQSSQFPPCKTIVSQYVVSVGTTCLKSSNRIVEYIGNGEKVTFAKPDIESRITVGNLGVDLASFESVAVEAIKSACENADVIVIDEVGKVEVESEGFVDAVKEALDVDKPMIITLHKKSRNPLLQDIRRRDDIRIFEVTPINRNLLPHKIMSLMNGEML